MYYGLRGGATGCLSERRCTEGKTLLSATAAIAAIADDAWIDLDAVTAHLSANGERSSLRQITDDATPADVILQIARSVDGSRIVLGLHHRSWIAKRMLGSTARSVVLAASCPVLIVPDIDRGSTQRLSADADAPPLRSMGQTPPWTQRKPDEGDPRSCVPDSGVTRLA